MSLLSLLRHRLVQFVVLGAALHGISPTRDAPYRIEIRSERLAALLRAEAARAGGVLGEARSREVEQRALEDEILYREGVRLGLDRNDGIERVAQKVLMLAEEMAGATRPPTEAELAEYLERTRSRWVVPARYRLRLVFRHDAAPLEAWARGSREGAPPTGEPSPLGEEIDVDAERLERTLGAPFVAAVAVAEVGPFIGPVPSPYGYFLARVIERSPARPARLDEVRASLTEALAFERRQEATAAYLRKAFARYRVTLDGTPLTRFEPTRRLAFRSVSSGED